MTAFAQALGAELIEALHGEMVPKFLATLGGDGRPNVVPIITLDAADPRTLVFAELFVWKTRDNLERERKVGACVVTEDLRTWTLRGFFRGWVESGPQLELLNRKNLFRYNAYLGVRRAAVIELDRVSDRRRYSKLEAASELLPVKLWSFIAGRREAQSLPPRVAEKYARAQALKVIAFRDADGFPAAVPLLSLTPSGSRDLLFGLRLAGAALEGLAPGAPLAASVITFDPIAYQVKGTYLGRSLSPAGWTGRMRVEEVYSASPPLPGERIPLQTA